MKNSFAVPVELQPWFEDLASTMAADSGGSSVECGQDVIDAALTSAQFYLALQEWRDLGTLREDYFGDVDSKEFKQASTKCPNLNKIMKVLF